ncbi:hypothetical protein ABTX81_24795 [Kitasatospora sp. NPDC097605]|uniref:hypothetical protein n=1 Tax=Kitasatospora sp. NPDC097605 TaxID=3157226 RepID=UPI00331CB402
MSYELSAVVGGFDALRDVASGIREAVVAPLRQRMGLLPVTGQLLDGTLSAWSSEGGPIASVEADFHGGDGYQTAAVWRAGAKVWGPVRSRDFSGPREGWPINAALALLGVVPSGHDLFLAVGLGREQDMDGWRSAGRAAQWAASYDEWHEEHERAARAEAEFEKRRQLADVPAALDGRAIMELLGLPPGPLIGAATRHLQELHLEHGPLSREEAVTRLRTWAVEH